MRYLLLKTTCSFYLLFSCLLSWNSCVAQVIKNIELESEYLSDTRTVKLYLPASYDTSSNQYPVLYVLDAEYMFAPTCGNSQFYAAWNKTPECIVVGLPHKNRWQDGDYNGKTGELEGQGVQFKQFITKELIAYIDSTYRTSSFRAMIGHSFTANYINYFAFDEHPLFNAFIALSPYYAKGSKQKLKQLLEGDLDKPMLYYLCTGEQDLSMHRQQVHEMKNWIDSFPNKDFVFAYDDFKNATHATLATYGLPRAIETIFSIYAPVSEVEYEFILNNNINPVTYILDYYKRIEQTYDLRIPFRLDDFGMVCWAVAEKKDWNNLKLIALETIKVFPEATYGYYALGDYYEAMGQLEDALQQYKKGYAKLAEEVSNKDQFYEDIERVEQKIKAREN